MLSPRYLIASILVMTPDKYIKNYVAGKLAPSNNGAYLETKNPSTKAVYAQYPDTQVQDITYAIESGNRACRPGGTSKWKSATAY